MTPTRLNNGTTYSYGFGLELAKDNDGHLTISHSGGWQGFNTRLRRYHNDGVSIVVLTNSSSAPTDKILQGIAERYNPRYGQKPLQVMMDQQPSFTALLVQDLAKLQARQPLLAKVPQRHQQRYRETLLKAGACRAPQLIKQRLNGDITERDYLLNCDKAVLQADADFDHNGLRNFWIKTP